jgi:N-acetylglucosaminyldiphosphoundecaprenol N-acetyl-beta-D-mannosaminyltransferase
MEEVRLLDLKIHRTNVPQLLDRIISAIKAREKLKIFHLNVHAFNIAFKNPSFKSAIKDGDIVFCDGFGVKMGARILGIPIGQRMTPPDWIDELCSRLAENNFSVFLLGDEPGVAKKCATKFLEKQPALKIAGTYHGFFTKTGHENENVVNLINESKPDVLLVGLGMPLQEKWITENLSKTNSSVFISVGAMFRWHAQIQKRGPKIFTDNGFEWLWRLFVQPKKVWKRYLIELPRFFIVILGKRLSRKP